jgi:hypothetical protein
MAYRRLMPLGRLAGAICIAVLALAGCGGGDKTATETKTETQAQAQATQEKPSTTAEGTTTSTGTTKAQPAPSTTSQGKRGPHYFETPSHNIGCYLDASGPRCDIRERSWSPPPEPASCKKYGVDYGQGIAMGAKQVNFVCAGDTALGGKAVLGYGQSAQRGPFVCKSEPNGITCTDLDNGHGFFLSRQSYRIF